MSVEKQLAPVEVTTDAGPSTVFVAVVFVKRREEIGIFGPVAGLDAHLRIALDSQARPQSLFLSRLADEVRWTADAHFGADGFPFYSHGFGTRVTYPKVLDRAVAALLDAEALRTGLVEEIDQDTPLVLPRSQS